MKSKKTLVFERLYSSRRGYSQAGAPSSDVRAVISSEFEVLWSRTLKLVIVAGWHQTDARFSVRRHTQAMSCEMRSMAIRYGVDLIRLIERQYESWNENNSEIWLGLQKQIDEFGNEHRWSDTTALAIKDKTPDERGSLAAVSVQPMKAHRGPVN